MKFITKYWSITILLLTISLTANAQQGEVNVSQDSAIDKLLEYKNNRSNVIKIWVVNNLD